MKNINVIPEVVVRRLPRYYRLLCELDKEGQDRVSSTVISKRLNITASQVRQDFSHFGAFGLQGYGYDVKSLLSEIVKILGLNKEYNIIIIGAGHIGLALANYIGFKKHGINVLSVFDIKTDGIVVPENVEIHHIDDLEKFSKTNKVDIAVITTQSVPAKAIAKRVMELEIPAIWNFSHADLQGDDNHAVENINLNESVFTLIYMLNNLGK